MTATGAIIEELTWTGAFVFAGGLVPPSSAITVDSTGASLSTVNGSLVETPEYLGGCWVIDVAAKGRALGFTTGWGVGTRTYGERVGIGAPERLGASGSVRSSKATLLPVWSLWSENSVLSICSQDSVLSIGSAASFASFASFGSFASAGSILSAMSAASIMSYQSTGSALSHQSNGSVLSSQTNHAFRSRRTYGSVPAAAVAAGVLATLTAIAVHRARR